MPSLPRKQASSQMSSRGSNASYGSQSITPTPRSLCYDSLRAAELRTSPATKLPREEPTDPAKCRGPCCDGGSKLPCERASDDTCASTTTSKDDLTSLKGESLDVGEDSIPRLPEYSREAMELNVRPSTPQNFGSLFPSLNRLTIRHDEFTSDGLMNLRVDTVVTGRERTAIQLFHLRMYDLAKRVFSLRRYCRDSGREVCNSKRIYIGLTEPKLEHDGCATVKRSLSTAIKSLGDKPLFRRANSGSTIPRPATSSSSSDEDNRHRHSIFHNGSNNSSHDSFDSRVIKTSKTQRTKATNTIKLEFSNYARVDVHPRGKKTAKRYEFQWWGHRYAWKRAADKQLGTVSYHLVRDAEAGAPIAHIVPETRSPSQVRADERAAVWVPPCSMWIADEKVVEAVTDSADVIMATGLMALVDDCIKEKWESKKARRISVPLTSRSVSLEHLGPKAIMQHVLSHTLRHNHRHASSALRCRNPISAY